VHVVHYQRSNMGTAIFGRRAAGNLQPKAKVSVSVLCED